MNAIPIHTLNLLRYCNYIIFLICDNLRNPPQRWRTSLRIIFNLWIALLELSALSSVWLYLIIHQAAVP